MLVKPELRRGKLFWGVEEGDTCPYCKVGIVKKIKGKWGDFFGCSQFPSCAFTEKIAKQKDYEEDY